MKYSDHRISIAISKQLLAAGVKLKDIQEEVLNPELLTKYNTDQIVKFQAFDTVLQDIDALAKCLSDWAGKPDLDFDDLFASVKPVELSTRLRGLSSGALENHDSTLF